MDNNSDLPEGWAKPADLAIRISELVNNEPYAPEKVLQEAIEDMVRDIALIEPNRLIREDG